MTFDVKQYELQDTAVVTIKDANAIDDLIGADGVNPVTVEIYSPGSPEGVRANHILRYKAAQRAQRMLRGEIKEGDMAKEDEDGAKRLVAYTKAINNFPIEPLAVYSNPRLPFFNRDVEAGIGKLANFKKGSSAS